MARATVIRHVAFEDLGVLSRLFEARGIPATCLDAGVDDLAVAPPDLLVVLGGPIGAYEEDRYPFLRDELRLIEECLRRDAPVLGICLGAQLIARALGARVYPGPTKEIGYAPIALTDAGRASCLAPLASAEGMVLHWHSDTFDLPTGAVRLASTAVTENQAFSVGLSVLGLQFHIEAESRKLDRWLIGHACELAGAGIDPRDLRAQRNRRGQPVEEAGQVCLSRWLDGLQRIPA
jgi:GMP synthase (glutamine-hydrolysing)